MVQKYFQCEICEAFFPIQQGKKAARFCSVSCRNKYYYRKRRANKPLLNHTHGLSHHPLYGKWESMWSRCTNPNLRSYKDYGGRGIKVDERWKDFAIYLKDVESLGPKPGPGYSIDRIDNNGNYVPGNIQWADGTSQRYNQRTRKDNKSGHRGVEWIKVRSKWVARFKYRGEHILQKYFDTKQEAIDAYHEAVRSVGVTVPCCS